MRGLYRKPRRSAFLDKPVPASPNEIAEALARKFEWCIAPYGDTALNQLGVDPQVPSIVRYVSDGPIGPTNTAPTQSSSDIRPTAICRV